MKKLLDFSDDELEHMITGLLQNLKDEPDPDLDAWDIPQQLALAAAEEVYGKRIISRACGVLDYLKQQKGETWTRTYDVLACAFALWQFTAKATYFALKVQGFVPSCAQNGAGEGNRTLDQQLGKG